MYERAHLRMVPAIGCFISLLNLWAISALMKDKTHRLVRHLLDMAKERSVSVESFDYDAFREDVMSGRLDYEGKELHLSKSDRLYVKNQTGNIVTPRFIEQETLFTNYVRSVDASHDCGPLDPGMDEPIAAVANSSFAASPGSLLDIIKERKRAREQMALTSRADMTSSSVSEVYKPLASLRDRIEEEDSVSDLEKRLMPDLSRITKDFEDQGMAHDDLVVLVDDFLRESQSGIGVSVSSGCYKLHEDGKITLADDIHSVSSVPYLFTRFVQERAPKKSLAERSFEYFRGEAKAWGEAIGYGYDLLDDYIFEPLESYVVTPILKAGASLAKESLAVADGLIDELTSAMAKTPMPTINRPQLAYATADIGGGELMGLREERSDSEGPSMLQKAASWLSSWF